MKKTLITLTAVLMVGFMAASAFAWGHGNGKRGGCGGQGQGMYNSLTDEQKTQLQELRQQFVDQTYETRSNLMTKHQEIRMLMETSNPDKTKLTTLSDEILALKKELSDKRIDFALQAKAIAPELHHMAFGPRGGMGMGRGCGNVEKGMGGQGCGAPCPYAGDGQTTDQ